MQVSWAWRTLTKETQTIMFLPRPVRSFLKVLTENKNFKIISTILWLSEKTESPKKMRFQKKASEPKIDSNIKIKFREKKSKSELSIPKTSGALKITLAHFLGLEFCPKKIFLVRKSSKVETDLEVSSSTDLQLSSLSLSSLFKDPEQTLGSKKWSVIVFKTSKLFFRLHDFPQKRDSWELEPCSLNFTLKLALVSLMKNSFSLTFNMKILRK